MYDTADGSPPYPACVLCGAFAHFILRGDLLCGRCVLAEYREELARVLDGKRDDG